MDYVINHTEHPTSLMTYPICGAKNAVLPQMCASLLVDQLELNNVPDILDVKTLISLLKSLGGIIDFHDHHMHINMQGLHNSDATYPFVSKMRASILVLAPLLIKLKKANVSLPGGCVIGTRPINFHLDALKALGANIELDAGNIIASAPNGLYGANISLPFPSVGATEQILLAAVLAHGTTEILNASHEPEVTDLIMLLTNMGAQIQGIHTDHLIVEGVTKLYSAKHTVIPDRIEAGSILTLMAARRQPIILKNIHEQDFSSLMPILNEIGVFIEPYDDTSVYVYYDKIFNPAFLTTGPYPAFPTDLQPQFMAMFATILKESRIKETVFENRFLYIPEFNRFGVDVMIEDNLALIQGGKPITGAHVHAFDIRSGFALLILGCVAQGQTIVHDKHRYIDRGYDNFVFNLQQCGIQIQSTPS